MIILDGRKVAADIERKAAETVKKLNRPVRLGIVSCGANGASDVYVRQKLKAAERCGIQAQQFRWCHPDSARRCIDNLVYSKFDGIIVQLPIAEEYESLTKPLLDSIPMEMDVDGLGTSNKARFMTTGNHHFAPCTPEGIMRLLYAYNIDPDGMNVTIIGRSELVGRPLAHMMLASNATVTVCHTGTSTLDLIHHCQQADIVVSACGVPKLITAEMLKDNAVVIDVGINRVDGKLCGDVDIESLEKTNCKVTPVPGGVGPMTVAMLMDHVATAAVRKPDMI